MVTAVATEPAPFHHAVGMTPIDELGPSPLNPRQRFTEADLADLQDNISKRREIIVPIITRRVKGQLEIIDGERRWRCAKRAQMTHVPTVERSLTDSEAIEIMLLASIQRQDLTPLEEARGFRSLIDSNKAKYSAAYIGQRIGRSEKWVFDRMSLLRCLPIVQELLKAERILVGHAELLAKLKPEDQQEIVTPVKKSYGAGGFREGGLWEHETRLAYDDDEKTPSEKNLFAGLKPVTVGELAAWIARHVRFDLEHMAAAAPLDFGATAKKVEAAELKPGRGKKVIQITTDHRATDDVRDDAPDRIYGSTSWRRADGQEKSKTCEHRVLGVVVAGAGQGTAFDVCIRRDVCQVHFAKEIRERVKNQKLRQSGKGGQAAQREAKALEKQRAEDAAREAERKAWQALKATACAAIDMHVKALPLKQLLALVIQNQYQKGRTTLSAPKTAEDLVRYLACELATHLTWDPTELHRCAKPFGFDVKQWVTAQSKASAKPAAKKR